MREQIIEKVLEKKLIAIARGVYDEDCVNLARALYDGGVELMEVTFDQKHPDRLSRTCETVKQLCAALGGKMMFGAGTVTSVEMVDLAYSAGARFIVSPDTNEAVIRRTRELGMVSMPGAMTPTEIMTAYACGADFVKVFPAGALGIPYVKAICAPINHIPMLAVGGVNEKNIADFLAAGLAGAGVGGNIVNKEWIKAGQFDKITELARTYVKNIG